MLKNYYKETVIKWFKTHPDANYDEHDWYVFNLLGDLFGYDFVAEIKEELKTR